MSTVTVNYRTNTTVRWLFRNDIEAEYRSRDMAKLIEVDSVYLNGSKVSTK